jgi:hypothetical protein
MSAARIPQAIAQIEAVDTLKDIRLLAGALASPDEPPLAGSSKSKCEV